MVRNSAKGAKVSWPKKFRALSCSKRHCTRKQLGSYQKLTMKIYLKEKIGHPDLFTGRNQEMSYLLNWIERIKPELSKSTALLARRKVGKTAILQRLYNLTFEKNNGVIPFYYEITEGKKWAFEFSLDFYLTFIYQYIAFKTRKAEYVELSRQGGKSFAEVKQAAQEVGQYLVDEITRTEQVAQRGLSGSMWDTARVAPCTLILRHDERVVQFIDEFQYLNSEIYWDEAKTNQANDFAAGYMSTAEYKNAPLLIAGSWVGWLMNDLIMMLPGRFTPYSLENIPPAEAVEMIYRYSLVDSVPVTERTVYLMAELTEGNPFYISGLFRSTYPHKDLTTEEGVLKTLEFETLHKNGNIRGTWLEYIDAALPRINEQYAKDIVLYLSKYRNQSFSRSQLKQILNITMSDNELDKKLKALLRSDIIEENYFKYQGVQDNIFAKIFHSQYGNDIDEFVPEGVRNEYRALFEELKEKYKSLSGEYNRYKGAYAEFMIVQHLLKAHRQNELYHTMLTNLPSDFTFVEYKSVWAYHSPPLYEPAFEIDIYAPAKSGGYTLIGEVKHRETTKFSPSEADKFLVKVAELLKLEPQAQYALFVYSSAGFTEDCLAYLQTKQIAWSEDKRWLQEGVRSKK